MTPDDALRAGAACRDAALDAVDRGLAAIPCCPPDHVGVGTDHARRCGSPGKSPLVRWKEFQDRLPTAAEVDGWWRRWPNANAYVVLGPVSGVVGVDVDGAGGRQALGALSGGDLPPTWEFGTGNGARLLYAIPPGFVPRVVHQHGEEVHDGLSLLGRGGGTVWPPSRHPSGATYTWAAGRSPTDLAPAPMPGWLVDRMRPSAAGRAAGRRATAATAAGAPITEPGRNVKLASLAGVMRRGGMTAAEVLAALRQVNADRCVPPLDDGEVERVADSVCRYPVGPDPFVVVARAAAGAAGGSPQTVDGDGVTDDAAGPASPPEAGSPPPAGDGPPAGGPESSATGGRGRGAGKRSGAKRPAGSPGPERTGPTRAKEKQEKAKKGQAKGSKRKRPGRDRAGPAADGRPPRDYGEALFRDEVELLRLAELKLDDPAGFEAERAGLRKRGVSIRGLDHALARWVDAVRAKRRAAADAAGDDTTDAPPEYAVVRGRLCRVRATDAGPAEVPLCNFRAAIAAEVAEDDGAEVKLRFRVTGALADGRPLPDADVPADAFVRMEWVTPAWGAGAVVAAGPGVRDHLRCAIQTVSGNVPRDHAYAHTGWREVGGTAAYLHAGGAVGADGPVPGAAVRLPRQLAGFVLPDPPDGDRLRAAVRASVGIATPDAAGRRLAPDPVTILTLVTPYRAAVGPADFAAGLFGASGAGKSELAALAQQHYGPGLDARHLPGSWTSTANALEVLAFQAKDALFVVDDFNPAGADPVQLRRAADRLIRGQGNGAGRDRLTADAGLKPPKAARGLLFLTGEDYPGGKSGMARLWAVDVPAGAVDFVRLGGCQRDAAAGLYAEAFAGWVRWLARDPARRAGYRERVVRRRAELVGVGGHARVPSTAADLLTALDLIATFAAEVGAVTAAEATDLLARGRAAVLAAADAQAAVQADADPGGRFLALVRAALASGRAHLADRAGERPTVGGTGWRQDGGFWSPLGRRIGWVDGGHVLLEPDAALSDAVRLAGEQGTPLVTSPLTLWRRLYETGHLAEVDARGGQVRFTVRKVVEGVQRRVLVLAASTILPDPDDDTGPADGGHGPGGGPAGRMATLATGKNAAGPHRATATPEEEKTSNRNGHNGHSAHQTPPTRCKRTHTSEVPL